MISRLVRPSAVRRATYATGRVVESHADDDAAIECGVRLSVATPREAVPAGGSPGRGRDRTRAAQLREGGFRVNPVWVIAEEDEHFGRRAGADTEARTEGGRRLSRQSREVPVVRRDFIGEGDPASGERPEGVLADAVGVSRGPIGGRRTA